LGLTPTPPLGTAAGAARVEGTSAARTGRRDDHMFYESERVSEKKKSQGDSIYT
jgi:hypothetical protein